MSSWGKKAISKSQRSVSCEYKYLQDNQALITGIKCIFLTFKSFNVKEPTVKDNWNKYLSVDHLMTQGNSLPVPSSLKHSFNVGEIK